MIELNLLGLHALRSSDGRGLGSLAAQPKRFALLSYLALGGDGFHRRDSLAAMFWPEMDQFAARRALRNTLYHLREALGEAVIVVQGNDAVSIDPAMLTCDVTRLGEAVEAGRYQEAVDLYRGELLPGIHVAAAGEAFEEWLSRERARVTDLVLRAMRVLTERQERAGDTVAAAYWAQRACELAPFDESRIRRAMTLLDLASDTGGALRLYESFVRRLATELDATPSPETAALAAGIRAGGRSLAAPADPAPSVAAVTALAEIAPSAPAASRHHSRRAMPKLILAGAVVAAGLAVLMVRRGNHGPGAGARPRVLIAVFDNRTGDPALQSLGRMTQDWLAQGAAETHLVDVVDPRAVYVQGSTATGAAVDPVTIARRTGAGMMVSGAYDRSGDTLFVQAAVTDVRTGRIVRVVGPLLSNIRTPVAALGELRSRVMSSVASAVDARATQNLGRSELPSFEAYRDYVEGWDAYWHGDGPRARALFLGAAHRDTTFTAAALAVAVVAANSNQCPLVDSLAGALGARARPLDRIDRLSLQIAGARCHGRNDEMLRLTLERAALEPNNSGDQMSAAGAALWANRPERALEALANIDPTVDLAWNTDSTHIAYFADVTQALHVLGRHHEELTAIERMPAGAPLARVWFRGSALAALSRPTAALALIDSALSLPVEMATNIGLAPYTDGRPQYTATPAWVANWISWELVEHGDTVAARQAARRGMSWYRSRPVEERSTPEERLVAAWSLEMLGDFPEAEEIARQLLQADTTNVDFRGELAGLAAESGDSALAGALDRWLAAQPPSRVAWSASLYRARVAALLGRREDAIARLREAMDEGAWPMWIHVDPAFAGLRGRPDFIALTAPK